VSRTGVQACRSSLLGVDRRRAEHAGLLLQRYLKAHKPKQRESGQQMPEEELIEAARRIGASPVYAEAFRRWQAWAQTQTQTSRVCFTMELATPLAIGLGNASPLEIGLTLHHTYGMPIIPGSALKGLCRRGALKLKREDKISCDVFEALFGKAGESSAHASAGYITFYDALYDPDSVSGKPFHRDVITVHHPKYYGGGNEPPTDFDDPTPVPFLVIKPGARFLFVLDAPTEEWGKFTKSLLQWCLCHLGVGAKTNAGYGYFKNPAPCPQSKPSASATAFTAQTETWGGVLLRYDAGRRALTASYGNFKAEASPQETQRLLAELPKEVQDLLLTQRSLKADVEVEQIGNMRKIVRIIPHIAGGAL
jgi:CRISPR-associated protein Cmr6